MKTVSKGRGGGRKEHIIHIQDQGHHRTPHIMQGGQMNNKQQRSDETSC